MLEHLAAIDFNEAEYESLRNSSRDLGRRQTAQIQKVYRKDSFKKIESIR
jgi:hypothetical protein